MKYILLYVLFFLALQRTSANIYNEDLKHAAEQLVINLENRGIERIVISDFQGVESTNDKLSTKITEELVTHILNSSSHVKVFERNQLEVVLKELRLQNSGLIEESTVQKAGKLLGAKVRITGKYLVEKAKTNVWLNAIEISSGLKIGAATCKIESYPRSLLNSKTKHDAGSLVLKNKTALTVVVSLYSADYEKEVYLSKNSQNQITDLPAGKYTFTAT